MAKDFDPSKLCIFCEANLTYYAESCAEGKPDKRRTTHYCISCYNMHRRVKPNKNAKNKSDKDIEKDEKFNENDRNNVDVETTENIEDLKKILFRLDPNMIRKNPNENAGVYESFLEFPNGKKVRLYVGESKDFVDRFDKNKNSHFNELIRDWGYFGVDKRLFRKGKCRISFCRVKTMPNGDNPKKEKRERKKAESEYLKQCNGTLLQSEKSDVFIHTRFQNRVDDVKKTLIEKGLIDEDWNIL